MRTSLKRLLASKNGRRPSVLAKGPPPLTVVIAMPAYGVVPSGFMWCLARMSAYLGASYVADNVFDLRINMVKATYLDRARYDLVQGALEAEATHMLWLDTDMMFPQDLIPRLLAHGKELVGVNYSTRRFPLEPTAYKVLDLEQESNNQRLWSPPDATGLEEVHALGFGGLLMQMNVLSNLPQPWFQVNWERGGGGEDIYFCNKVRQHGHQVWVDHDLSREIRHIGEFEYALDHALAWREQDQAQSGVADGVR